MNRIILDDLLYFLESLRKCVVVARGEREDIGAVMGELAWRNWRGTDGALFCYYAIPLVFGEDHDGDILALLGLSPEGVADAEDGEVADDTVVTGSFTGDIIDIFFLIHHAKSSPTLGKIDVKTKLFIAVLNAGVACGAIWPVVSRIGPYQV